MSHDHPQDSQGDALTPQETEQIHAEVRNFWRTFYVLTGMTVVMFGLYFIPMPAAATGALVLGITALKSVVAAFFFMHLIGARKFVHQFLVFTAVFAIFLLGLSLLAWWDHTHIPFF
ncbi:MAG: cytochrome C oxidase subunit IV family protein [Candidatus Methylacidiphilales bacterium]|nr:cytochrome C oxidase subunit IV family protein [Candidatus Methylacidiphilales bacterium]